MIMSRRTPALLVSHPPPAAIAKPNGKRRADDQGRIATHGQPALDATGRSRHATGRVLGKRRVVLAAMVGNQTRRR
jgi:hypothetical protein